MKKIAAIYHFTDGSECRPSINKKQLQILEEFAREQGFSVGEIYCDKSLLKREQDEFRRFLSEVDKYDVLVTKDFYHISKNTSKCMKVMEELRSKGVQMHTIENGSFTWQEAAFDKPLKVATYICKTGTPKKMQQIINVQNDILKLFIRKKTKWSIIDQYSDISERQVDGEQIELKNLMKNRDKYNLILVHSLNDIHWRTTNFCKIREHLKLDIYSLQEGFLKYNTKEVKQ